MLISLRSALGMTGTPNVADSYGQAVYTDAPIAWYRGDGNANDYMGGLAGTLTNGAVATGAAVPGNTGGGQSFSLDGTNDYVAVADQTKLRLLAPITVECWVVPASVSAGFHGAAGSVNWLIERNVDKFTAFTQGTGSITGATTIVAGQIYHVVAVWSGGNVKLYVNGALDATGTAAAPPSATNGFRIGSYDGASEFWDGRVDEVAVYDYALTPTQITSHYQAGLSTAPGAGTATGSTTWTGTAAGKRSPKATATGSTTWTGTSSGKRVAKATATGATTFTGSAAGVRAPKATATGATTWTGTATGKRTPKATATGATTWTGAATGKRVAKATATGDTTWTGAATGKRVAKATGTGLTTWTGSAVASSSGTGTATGATTWTGSATGRRTPKATAGGNTVWAGTAAGSRAPRATATGATVWVGTAAGQRAPKATGTGLTTWVGTAVGGATDIYFPHVVVDAVISYTPGTATLVGLASTAALAVTPAMTATLDTVAPMTAVLNGNGTGTAVLTGNGVGTATVEESYALAALQYT